MTKPGWDKDAVWPARLLLHLSDSLPSASFPAPIIQNFKLHFLTDLESSKFSEIH